MAGTSAMSIFYTVTGYLFAWLWAFFAIQAYGPIDNATRFDTEPRLPGALGYYQTPDNSLLGDGAWKRCEPAHWSWRTRFERFPLLYRYLGRVGWLMRNPGQGYDDHISATIMPGCRFTYSGNPNVQDKPDYQPGTLDILAINPDGSSYYQHVSISRAIFGFCWLYKSGWNLQTYINNPGIIQPKASHVFTFRPSGITTK
jgi:hypothetical protein